METQVTGGTALHQQEQSTAGLSSPTRFHFVLCLKKGTGELERWLESSGYSCRTLGSVLSTHMVAHSYLQLLLQEI